jgi:hypothetical protein
MRKYLISFSLALILIIPLYSLFSASLGTDFNVKFSTAGDATYTTDLADVSRNNTDVTFQFVESSNGGYEEYSINLPTGFTFTGTTNTGGTTCAGFTVINASNNNYHFSFNGTGNCIAKTEFSYRITGSASTGTQSISLLQKNGTNWNVFNTITLGVVSSNTITKALTQDTNGDGFIDAYLLSFSTG